MIIEDQTAVVEFMGSPSTHGGAAVERIETHASVVFLAGTCAWKLKRAVRYDYLDFSTVDRRRAMCELEFRINCRLAPDIYRRVVPVTRETDGSLALGGCGVPVEWLIQMGRFDQDELFDRLAGRGALTCELMRSLATAIAQFHLAADRRSDHGGRAGMSWVIDGNARGFNEEGRAILDAATCAALIADSRRMLERCGPKLDARREVGFVRQCHGDLHLRNIVLLDGHPTLFDAVEFNDEIRCIDVLYDLAFLLMDLWRRRLPRHAHAVWNTYLAETRDLEGVSLLPLFLSCRAAVRAKTSATASGLQNDERRRREFQETSREYLGLAGKLLRPPPACLVAIGGLSGSGKSTLALSIAPEIGAVPGALVLRSDEVRKRLYGLPPQARLGRDRYSPETSECVYRTLSEHAGVILRQGHSVITDAVFARFGDRRAIERVAAAAGVPFLGFWLDAPDRVLIDRVDGRHGDASEADAKVIQEQRGQDPGPISWQRVNASSSRDEVRLAAQGVLRRHLGERICPP